MLEIVDLTVAYGPVVALERVSFRVAEGSVTAVLGANGAGKTTLVRTISGLVRPRSGSIRFNQKEISRLAPGQIVSLPVADTVNALFGPRPTSAVVLNVTAVNPSNDGFITVFPCGTAPPGTCRASSPPPSSLPQ